MGLWQNDLLGSLGSTSLNVIAAIIFTYLCGLLSFTIGKTIRATVIMYRRKHYVLLVKVEETRFMTCFKEAVRYANKKREFWQIILTKMIVKCIIRKCGPTCGNVKMPLLRWHLSINIG